MVEFIRKITDPHKWVSYLLSKKVSLFLPDKLYLDLKYWSSMDEKINWSNPTTFNEKLQWLKLYDRKPEYTMMVDKYKVRKHIACMIGEEYLIPLLGVWERFEDINFDKLPNQFVLKCTHDSGGLIICNDKSKLNLREAKKKMNKSLKRNFYYQGREWPYKNVKPRIICEKYMVDESGTELKDYKFMCFNGEVKCSFVCLNRNSSMGLSVDFYDMNWEQMPFERHYPHSGTKTSKPKTYNKMVDFARELSRDIPFVRVDFYEANDRLFFGELTFYPGSGYEKFTPEKYDYLLGSWIRLPDKVNI